MTATARTAGTESNDLVAVLLGQHRALERRTEVLQGGGDGERERLAAELVTDLRRYGQTLEEHLDPLVRRYLPDGLARADRQLGEHSEVERVVAQLRRHRPDDALFDELLGRLISQLRNHLAEQQQEMLPRVREHVPAEVLRQRGVLAARPRCAAD